MNHEQPIIVGLDIGTTKIAAIAGRKNEFDQQRERLVRFQPDFPGVFSLIREKGLQVL